MKKVTSYLIILLIIISGIFAKDGLINFSGGLSTGIPFYGSSGPNYYNNQIQPQKRFIIGTYGTINLNPLKQVTFFTGADFLADCIWNNPYYSNHIHFDFPLGIKLYPNLAGFNFGLAYLLGFRADFIFTYETGKINPTVIWGNGFKIFIEYDFSKNSKHKYLPSFGLNWSSMPRGQMAYDNIITFYTGITF